MSTDNIQEVISRGDVSRSKLPDTPVPLYQGNGRFGACYGPLGLHVGPGAPKEWTGFGRARFTHMRHFFRGKHKADYLLGLARMYWADPPAKLDAYRQHQSFHDGTVVTNFAGGGRKLTITTWFDPVNANVAGFLIDVEAGSPEIVFEPMAEQDVHYGQRVKQDCDAKVVQGGADVTIAAEGVRTEVALRTDAAVRADVKGLRLTLHQGVNAILVSVGGETDVSATESLERTRAWWRKTWQSGGWVDLPDDGAQKVWVRSAAYILCSANDDKLGMMPPCGLTGNGWPFSFPQDLSYIHPALLAMGRIDVARSWIEYWAEQLPAMKRYTRRLLKTDGVLMPWAYSYGGVDGFHDPEPPNINYYELHNTGYLCRMAHETALAADDPSWTAMFATPLIAESAAFFQGICRKEGDGYWHIHVEPSAGQDEFGGRNQKDYLCALYSAQYCFQTAIARGLDEDGSMTRILDDGLAIGTLKSKRGYLLACAGTGEEDFGKQKHFTQLNPLVFLPVHGSVRPEVRRAYEPRYEINQNINKPFFNGWTGGQIVLAGTRMGDAKGWARDWANLLKADYFDPELVQNYETSTSHGMSFYVTTHGLLAQTLMDNAVCSWWGRLDVGRCLPWQGPVRFGRIRSLLGVDVSGIIENGKANVTLTAWKDCTVDVGGEKVTLKMGEAKSLTLDVGDQKK